MIKVLKMKTHILKPSRDFHFSFQVIYLSLSIVNLLKIFFQEETWFNYVITESNLNM